MQRYFDFAGHGATYRKEILAGATTFLTMAYIIVVNPAILEAAGIPKGPSMTATIISAAFGTLVMGFYAKRPFAIAPYMGENAFIAYTVVKVLGYPWQTALGAIFLAGLLDERGNLHDAGYACAHLRHPRGLHAPRKFCRERRRLRANGEHGDFGRRRAACRRAGLLLTAARGQCQREAQGPRRMVEPLVTQEACGPIESASNQNWMSLLS